MIVLDLPLPPPINKTRRIDWRNYPQVKAWRETAHKHVMASGKRTKIKGPFEIHILLGKSRTDLDATIKTLIDYCVRIELVEDDSPKYLRRIVVEWGEAPEGCRITLKPFAESLRVTGLRRQAMLDYVAAHPHGVTVDQIMSAVYADDRDGGATSRKVVPVMAHYINKTIAPLGFQLTATGGPGSLYTLAPIG